MATLEQLARDYAAVHPTRDGGTWDQWCGSLMFRMCDAYGNAPTGDISSAWTVWKRTPTAGTDPSQAPVGAFHFFDIAGPSNGHVGLDVRGGGGKVFMATRAVTENLGTAIGFASVGEYLAARPAATYVGWCLTYADGDVTSFSAPAPLADYQRVVGAGGVNRRGAPNTSGPVLEEFPAGEVLDFDTWTHGENPYGTNDIWFNGRYSDTWFYSGAFTDSGTHGLTESVVTPPPVVTPPTGSFGIDISTSQAGIDLVQAKTEGTEFVIVKASGLNVKPQYVAPHYAEQVDAARSAGLHVGHYYLVGDGQSPAKQADYFVDNLHAFDVNTDVLALDNERLDDNATFFSDVQAANFFKQVIARTGIPASRLWLYSSASDFRSSTWKNVETLGVRIWWAAYGSNVDSRTPDAEPDLRGAVSKWDVHQFSSVVTVAGRKVDANYSKLPVEELFAKGATVEPTPEPTPEEPPVPTNPPVVITVPDISEQDVADAEVLINDVLAGRVSFRDTALRYIRTYVPYLFSLVITWVSTFIPAVGDFYNGLGDDVKVGVVAAIVVAFGSAWYFVGSKLGKKWPLIEKLMLGSSKKPVAYAAPVATK